MKNIKSAEREDKELDESSLPERSNVVKLAYSGGGDPVPWLRELEVGTIFLCRLRSTHGGASEFALPEFCKVGESERGVRLAQPQGLPGWVDPIRFCARMELVEEIGKQHFEELGDSDDADQGTV
jgi:hypothetical protein